MGSNDMMTEKQAHAYVCDAVGRNVCLKTLTNLRKKLGAARDENTNEWFYPSQSVKGNWVKKVRIVQPELPKSSNAKKDVSCMYDKYASVAAALEMLDKSGYGWEITIRNKKGAQ